MEKEMTKKDNSAAISAKNVICPLPKEQQCKNCTALQDAEGGLMFCKILTPYVLFNITDRCTRACDHCMQDAGPSCKNHASLETARAVRAAAVHNNLAMLIYGGEIICHPQWELILDILLTDLPDQIKVHIHTNGDWVKNPQLAERFLAKLDLVKDGVGLQISYDGFHEAGISARACDCVEERAKRGGKAWLKNKRCKNGQWYSQERDSSPVMPFGRGVDFPCKGSDRWIILDDCPYNAVRGSQHIAYCYQVTPDGSIWRSSCGVGYVANINDVQPYELPGLWTMAWMKAMQRVPTTCADCLDNCGGDCAWRTHKAPAGRFTIGKCQP